VKVAAPQTAKTAARPSRSPQARLEAAEALRQAATDLTTKPLTAEAAMDAVLDLAQRHVRCASIQLLLPLGGAEQLRVVGARGHLAPELVRARLTPNAAAVTTLGTRQAASHLARVGWAWRYVRPTGEHFDIDVIDVLWVPVRYRGRLLAGLALLNSQHPDGFVDAEAEALDVVAMALANAMSLHL
jgi:hypothetical protein